ncbi:unnamed protein product [Absidia cylindrospora]
MIPTPPLDIAFMWHTHLLSPFRYYEDLVLRIPSAKLLLDTPIPLEALHRESYGPTNDTLVKWARLFGETGEPYELNVDNMASGVYSNPCISCKHEIKLPWTTYVGYRYGENTTPFDHPCGINRQINFLDVARMKLEHDLTSKGKKGPTVAGTLLRPDGMPRTKRNTVIPFIVPLVPIDPQNEMDYSYELQIEDKLKSLGKKYEYDANELLYAIRTCYQGNPSPFSIDLIHAVARQRKFYDAAISMDWSTTNAFASAIRRYHDFLTLMKKDPSFIAVPTIEIDCAWHTHMLFAGSYRTLTRNKLKRVINHDDTIPELSLKKFANDTNKAWARSPVKYWIAKIERPKGSVGPYEVSLTVDDAGLGGEYYPGKVHSHKNDGEYIASLLNGQIIKSTGETPARVSAHCQDIPSSFYRKDMDAQQLKSMQNFIGEGMKKTSYGYVGTASCGTGGKSAIYSSEDRNHTGKVISSDEKRWYQLNVSRLQNKFRDLEVSTSTSDRFHDNDKNQSIPRLRQRQSRDDICVYTNQASNDIHIRYSSTYKARQRQRPASPGVRYHTRHRDKPATPVGLYRSPPEPKIYINYSSAKSKPKRQGRRTRRNRHGGIILTGTSGGSACGGFTTGCASSSGGGGGGGCGGGGGGGGC